MMKQKGSCHCGAVAYEVEGDFEKGMECNCSHCQKKGFLLAFVPAEQFSLKSGEESLTEYRFNKKTIAHLFCKACGVQAFGRGQKKDGTPTVMINLRCLDSFEATEAGPTLGGSPIAPSHVNGKDF